MSNLSLITLLSWALAAFFLLGAIINTFATNLVGPEYQRWGFPNWFHFVTGALELAVSLLLPAMLTRPFGVALGCAIMFVAIVILVWHREYHRTAPPLIVFALLAIAGWTI